MQNAGGIAKEVIDLVCANIGEPFPDAYEVMQPIVTDEHKQQQRLFISQKKDQKAQKEEKQQVDLLMEFSNKASQNQHSSAGSQRTALQQSPDKDSEVCALSIFVVTFIYSDHCPVAG